MKHILIIGAGGVARVACVKCAMDKETFKKITIASRTLSKCEEIASFIKDRLGVSINVAKIDADDVDAVAKLIEEIGANLLLNLALPYQDLSLMKACLKAKIPYIDTANYEHPKRAKFEYKEQWAMDEDFKKAGLMALLGCGFDPGTTNVFCAYAQKNLFDEIHYIDILDCNAGDHGLPFATNFNPEINLREVSAKGRYWQEGKWIETEPLEIKKIWDYPHIGKKDSYLLYHEELESLVKNIKALKRIRFFMTFSQNYITHMKCLENVGLLGIKPVLHQGVELIPIQFLSTLLPNPASLGPLTKGLTNIGCVIRGLKDAKDKQVYIYNICDHEKCFEETNAQAVSYTTGVPAMIAAKLVMNGIWDKKGCINVEELDPDFFVEEMKKLDFSFFVEQMKPSLGNEL